MASPQAAGAAALLLSAGKQSGTKIRKPAALRQAMYSSAATIPGVPTFLQGHGEVNVPRAWALFSQNLKPVDVTVSAPVCNEVWDILGRTSGTGLYDRCSAADGGPVAGTAKSYPVTLTRTSGPAAATAYRVRVVGDDAFTPGDSTVVLPRGKAVTLQVDTLPRTGTSSALLQLDDPKTAGLDAAVMMAITASNELAGPSFTQEFSGTSYRNETTRHYVTVPEGATALQVNLDGLAEGSQTRFIAFHPFGLPVDSTSSLACYSNRPSSGCDPAQRVYAQPQPGVWELVVESRRTSPLLENPYELSAKVLGLTVTPPVQTLDSVEVGAANDVSWTVRNEFGPVEAKAVGGPLGSRQTVTESIADGGELVRTVVVPEGATRFDVAIGGTSDPGADLDLYVTSPSGEELFDADGDSEEQVSFTDPEPGEYEIVIDGYEVPAGTTTFSLSDAFTSPALGTLSVPSDTFTLDAGESRTITGTVTAAQAAPEGRSLSGQMQVVSTSGAVLGTGLVLIDEVTAP